MNEPQRDSKFITLHCGICGQQFERKRSIHQHSVNRGGSSYVPKCSDKTLLKTDKFTELICAECGNAFSKRTSEFRKSQNKGCKHFFCNHQCANLHLARISHEEAIKRKSLLPVKTKTPRVSSLLSTTKGELFQKRSNWQSARSAIQQHARKVFFASDKPKRCHECGYDRHIEVCHIRDVADFPDTATIGEINDPTNLRSLCPNHHWEFDHGLLIMG